MKSMKLRKYVATLLLLLVSAWSVPASPQAAGNGIAAIKTNDGYLVVWNQPDIHFTLGLKGKDVRPMSSPGTGSAAFNVDGVVFQIQSVAISEFVKNAKKQKLSDQSILIAHRDWESQYLEQTVGTKLNVTTAPQQLSNGSQALIWKYDKPKTKGSEQMYLTMVSGTNVVILNGVVSERITASVVQQLLLNTISTLRVSSRPIDVIKLRESIR
jgi:hypothetical protein